MESRRRRNRRRPFVKGRPTHLTLPRTPLQARLRRLLTRRYLDDTIDRVRFSIDTFPRSVRWLRWLNLPSMHSAVYQDLPWVGVRSGARAESTRTRWDRMRPLIDEHGVRSALDVGANTGWFAFSLAERGVPTIALERMARHVRIGLYVRQRAGLCASVAFLVMDVTPENVDLLPSAECVIFLSIWHHVVREHGLQGGTAVLRGLWAKTGKLLFFETGEAEMPASYGLPAMTPEPRAWLTKYLEETCPGARVVPLGRHVALDSDNVPARRNLFALVRT
jgi:hypothetical protein